MKNPFLSRNAVGTVAVFAALALVPMVSMSLGEPFWTSFFARVLVYAIAASALNLALGYGGLVSFGHALFLGLGVYSVALPSLHGVGNGFVHLLICVLASGLVAFFAGLVCLRTSGMAFIMITLAFAQMGYFLFVSLKQYGGDDGMPVSLTSLFGSVNLGNVDNIYLVSWTVLALLTWWMAKLRLSPFGMALRGARQNARRISAVGLPVRRIQLVAFVMSGMVCSVAGFLLANLNAFASPTSMAWIVSGELIVMVVLGGIGTVVGPVIGALVYLGLEEIIKAYTTHWMAILGPLMVILTLLGREGVVGMLTRLGTRNISREEPSGPVVAAGSLIAQRGVK